MEQARILVADDDGAVRDAVAEQLISAGHEADRAADGRETLERLRERPYDLLLCDVVFPPSDGIEILREAKRIRPATIVVLFSGYADVETVLRGFRAGAYDFLTKPVDFDQLRALARRAIQVRTLGERRRRLAVELESEREKVLRLRQRLAVEDPFQKLIGHSGLLGNFVDMIREVARTESTVLLTGESGTGKSLVARTIHEASDRAERPFVEANCVVYSEGVLQSELFGHERGAFTGAARTKKGRFELAHGGTLFLDEIGEIPAATQLMLLRVLNDRAFERVGGEETMEADVRLIAATNRDLQEAITQGTFRSDLYYRLNVIPIHLPPLREHADDVPVLTQHFLARCATRLDREAPEISDEAIEALQRYRWPGNVRELENVVERVIVLCRSGRVEAVDLPSQIRDGLAENAGATSAGTLQELERNRIVEALDQAGGNKKLAAGKLGIHRSTLYAKLRRYGLLDGAARGNGSNRREGRETGRA